MTGALFKTSGACACMAVRFQVLLESSVALCHCELCRRTSGGPLQGWVNGVRASLTHSGKTTTWRSSSHATRHFCGRCGSSLFLFEDEAVDMVEVAVGALEDQAAITSHRVGFRDGRPPWFPNIL